MRFEALLLGEDDFEGFVAGAKDLGGDAFGDVSAVWEGSYAEARFDWGGGWVLEVKGGGGVGLCGASFYACDVVLFLDILS